MKMSEVDAVYNAFWKEIVENPDGSLNVEEIKANLFDFKVVMDEVTKVYNVLLMPLGKTCDVRSMVVSPKCNEVSMKEKSALELAQEHWDWLEPIVKKIPPDCRDDGLLRYLFITSWLYGAKHEREKRDNGN